MKEIGTGHSLSGSVGLFTREKIEQVYIRRLKTGFPKLDALLGGGLTEGLTVLGAISGLGKSTFALQLAQNVAAEGTPVLFFSLEMSAARIASKAISRQLFLNAKECGRGEGTLIEADRLLNQEFARDFGKKWDAIDAARKTVEQETGNLYVIEGGKQGLLGGADLRAGEGLPSHRKEKAACDSGLSADLGA